MKHLWPVLFLISCGAVALAAPPTQILTLQIPTGGGSNPSGSEEVFTGALLKVDSGATLNVTGATLIGFPTPSGVPTLSGSNAFTGANTFSNSLGILSGGTLTVNSGATLNATGATLTGFNFLPLSGGTVNGTLLINGILNVGDFVVNPDGTITLVGADGGGMTFNDGAFLNMGGGTISNAAIDAGEITTGILAVAQGGTGISSLGTGVATGLGTNVNSGSGFETRTDADTRYGRLGSTNTWTGVNTFTNNNVTAPGYVDTSIGMNVLVYANGSGQYRAVTPGTGIGFTGGVLTSTVATTTQNANAVYAGPSSGSAAAPTFRSLVSADIPNNAANTTGNATHDGSGNTITSTYAALSGAAFTGASSVTASSSTLPSLVVNNNGAATFLPIFNFYAPNMIGGQQMYLNFGKDTSGYDSGSLGFNYVGAGSTSNFVSLAVSFGPGFTFDGNGNFVNPGLMTAAGVTDSITGNTLGSRAPIASPTFTGTPAAPTASPGTNTTQLATTAFVLANSAGAITVQTGTLSGGTATKTVIAGTHPWVQDNATTLTNVGSLIVTVSGTTATITSTNPLDTSPFSLFNGNF